jgi:hypothetical protein
MQTLCGAKKTSVAVHGQQRITHRPAMKRSLKLHLLFFVLVAALLARVTMGIPPKARAEAAPICSADAPARPVQTPQPLAR